MIRGCLIAIGGRRVLSAAATRYASTSQGEQGKNSDFAQVIDYEDPPHLPVPEYPTRPNEPLETRKQRLLYQSRKRGMLENDLLLSTFVAKHLKDFDATQTAQYDELINGVSNDWDIYYWATQTKPTPPQFDTEIMRMLKEHVKNVERVQRIRQPDL